MRRIMVLLTCMTLTLLLILPCGAAILKPKYQSKVFAPYTVYQSFIIGATAVGALPDDFIHYRQISSLGAFCHFSFATLQSSSYSYRLNDGKHEFILSMDSNYSLEPPLYSDGFIPYHEVSITDVADDLHMIKLRDGIYINNAIFWLEIGELKYFYRSSSKNAPPELIRIKWLHKGIQYTLNSLYHYPAGQDTLVGRLLNYETAEAAVDELMADVDGDYEMPAEDWHLIVPRILGVITFITLLAVGIRRSKKKKAALAGGEDGMDDAGEDVDSANKSDSGREETDSGGAKISGGENADISRDDTVPNPPTAPG